MGRSGRTFAGPLPSLPGAAIASTGVHVQDRQRQLHAAAVGNTVSGLHDLGGGSFASGSPLPAGALAGMQARDRVRALRARLDASAERAFPTDLRSARIGASPEVQGMLAHYARSQSGRPQTSYAATMARMQAGEVDFAHAGPRAAPLPVIPRFSGRLPTPRFGPGSGGGGGGGGGGFLAGAAISRGGVFKGAMAAGMAYGAMRRVGSGVQGVLEEQAYYGAYADQVTDRLTRATGIGLTGYATAAGAIGGFVFGGGIPGAAFGATLGPALGTIGKGAVRAMTGAQAKQIHQRQLQMMEESLPFREQRRRLRLVAPFANTDGNLLGPQHSALMGELTRGTGQSPAAAAAGMATGLRAFGRGGPGAGDAMRAGGLAAAAGVSAENLIFASGQGMLGGNALAAMNAMGSAGTAAGLGRGHMLDFLGVANKQAGLAQYGVPFSAAGFSGALGAGKELGLQPFQGARLGTDILGTLRERSMGGKMTLPDIAGLMRFGGFSRNAEGAFTMDALLDARVKMESGEGFTAKNIKAFLTEDMGGMGGTSIGGRAHVARHMLNQMGIKIGSQSIKNIMEGKPAPNLMRQMEGGFDLSNIVKDAADPAQKALAGRQLGAARGAEDLTTGFVELQGAQEEMDKVMTRFNTALEGAAVALMNITQNLQGLLQ